MNKFQFLLFLVFAHEHTPSRLISNHPLLTAPDMPNFPHAPSLNPFYKSFSAVAVEPEESGSLKGPSRLSIFNPDFFFFHESMKSLK